MSLLISVGQWGDFHKRYTTRLVLGWISITFIPLDDGFISDIAKINGWNKR